jgi:hypothetical protein
MIYNREQYMQSALEDRLEEQHQDWRMASEQMLEAGVDLTEAECETLH